ncbi:efflux RND transporter periplasmic adaptor subunit [Thauera sinica]|uniref:Efflux RND transporter periplasmic adaptor subunit n=1 Tax=Thauera sinica TaxID=2665146 RepID=A0ABW1AS75_9RHOO|nr:efflux RND transporter periplasmic adaptor subunit [Thauera sp. K11]ATE61111.1 efflux transporter periplasmic adaptor subunit [Thauera sp. K11]
MKPALQLTLAAAVAILALGAGYLLGSRGAGEGGGAPAPAPAGGERKILYYRNPMGLPDTSPVPKKDSMGMDYIPVYADDRPDDGGTVAVSPARIQTLGVKTEPAGERVVDEALRAVGRVEIDERAVVEVAPRFEGWIERLHVNAIGDPVRRGQPLFTAYSPELQSAGEELRIAERLRKDSAEIDPAAAQSAQRLAEAARARLRNLEVAGQTGERQTFASPAGGVVLEKNAVQGARFMPGETIYRIADLSSVWVIADVFEQDLARVRVGQAAAVTLPAYPGRSFTARVGYIYPTLDAATRSTRLRLELPNREGLLRPGMFAHVELATGAGTPRLAVPASAVIDDGIRQVVLLALDEGRFRPQPVKLGARGRDYVEVREGLRAGERVVVSANFLLDSESQLKAALSGFADGDAGGGVAAAAYRAEGVIEAVDLAANSVTLAHGPIPALNWPEMSMDFGLARPDLAAGLAPGTAVRFEFEQRAPGEFVVTRIDEATPPAAGTAHEGH